MLKLEYKPYQLDFTFDAGTSRGVMKDRQVWFVKITDSLTPSCGYGEVAPLQGLSVEKPQEVASKLEKIVSIIDEHERPESIGECQTLANQLSSDFPGVRFGLEMALMDLVKGGKQLWYDNTFTNGKSTIPINGLIWMGDKKFMQKQIDDKVDKGFSCIKMKVGAMDLKEELSLMKYVRSKSEDIVLRLDANGAFPINKTLSILNELEEFNIHSIEQPILPSQPEAMALICRKSPVPIALDEELIGVPGDYDKAQLLDFINPPFIILKPSLLGGFQETVKWINLAEIRGIGWWITSALESNIGLNAISQFAGQFSGLSFQGLGTGQLFHNNFDTRIYLDGDHMYYDHSRPISLPF